MKKINTLDVFGKEHYMNSKGRVDFFENLKSQWGDIQKNVFNKLNEFYENTIMTTHGFLPHEMDIIIKEGEYFTEQEVVLKEMRVSRCHDNAQEYVNKNKNAIICSGFGLSEDGVWRPHSWVLENNIIIETTEKRICYFGMKLDTPIKLGIFGFGMKF